MKVVFDHLDKYKLLVNAYHSLQSDPIKADVDLTYEQLMFLDNTDEVDTINGTYLGVRFKGNYVEFDDSLSETYINLIYKAKIRSPYFEATMQEDEIIFMQYKLAKEDITEFEKCISELEDVILMTCEHLKVIETAIKIYPYGASGLEIQMNELSKAKDKSIENLKKLKSKRLEKIMYIFGLEGPIKEFVEEEEDDLVIKEL